MTRTRPPIPYTAAGATAVTASSSGVTGLLTVAFIVLKLLGVITWPWIWVLAPFWVPLVIFTLVAVIFLGVVGVAAARDPKPVRR